MDARDPTMQEDELGNMGVAALTEHYRNGSVSPLEATRAALSRIERFNPTVNAYTYIDAEIRNDANAALIGSPLSNVPAHAGSLFVLKQLGPWGIGGGVTYVGSRAGDPFGTDYRLPAYTVARANLSYDIAPEVTIRADLDNLFDTYYISSSYANVWTTPGAPRNFRITLSTRFP